MHPTLLKENLSFADVRENLCGRERKRTSKRNIRLRSTRETSLRCTRSVKMSNYKLVIMPHLSTVSKETLTNMVVDSWKESPHIVTLPDLRGENISCRCLPVYLSFIIRCSCRRSEMHWGDQRMKPVWWPKRLPFENPGVQPWYNGAGGARMASIKQHVDLMKACYDFFGGGEYFKVAICYGCPLC